jgi:hypothetical protein
MRSTYLAATLFLVVAVVLYQTAFRYQYLIAASGFTLRADRLTGTVCVAFPPDNPKRCPPAW